MRWVCPWRHTRLLPTPGWDGTPRAAGPAIIDTTRSTQSLQWEDTDVRWKQHGEGGGGGKVLDGRRKATHLLQFLENALIDTVLLQIDPRCLDDIQDDLLVDIADGRVGHVCEMPVAHVKRVLLGWAGKAETGTNGALTTRRGPNGGSLFSRARQAAAKGQQKCLFLGFGGLGFCSKRARAGGQMCCFLRGEGGFLAIKMQGGLCYPDGCRRRIRD